MLQKDNEYSKQFAARKACNVKCSSVLRSIALKTPRLSKVCPVCLAVFSQPDHYAAPQFMKQTCCSQSCANAITSILNTLRAVSAQEHRSRPGVIVTLDLQEILVDLKDWYRLMRYAWTLSPPNTVGARYARTNINGKTTRLASMVLSLPPGYQPDHINRNTLDNRKENLRIATRSQNAINRRVTKPDQRSQYRGVRFFTQSGKWRAAITQNRRMISLGLHRTELEAALAYDNAATRIHGEFAQLNFADPEESAS